MICVMYSGKLGLLRTTSMSVAPYAYEVVGSFILLQM